MSPARNCPVISGSTSLRPNASASRSAICRMVEASPLPMFSPRGLYWAGYRANLRIGGFLSKGIALGLKSVTH